MTTDQALLKIAAVTAQAVADALRELCGPQVEPGVAKIVADGEHPLADAAAPAVVARVAYVGGASGGSLFSVPVATARHLAAAMMGADPPDGAAGDLSEIEHSAFAEAMTEALVASARSLGALLGADVEVDAPAITAVASHSDDDVAREDEVHAARVDLTLAGAPFRLVQLVPDEFVAQLTRTLDESLSEHDGGPLKAALRDIPVRVWVELGRATMPLGRFVALPAGEVVELDRDIDDPVDLYVDGMRVARGRLAVSDSGELLTLRIESLVHAEGALAAHAAAVPLANAAAA
jgi:flagellar motor switch protein FliN